MRKISYPTDLNSFHDEYFNCFDTSIIKKIDKHLQQIEFSSKPLNFKTLVNLGFDDLIDLSQKISEYSIKQNKQIKTKTKEIIKNEFQELFDYKKNQPKIAKFFMQNDCFNLNICHYCGIEYVYAFIDLDDYICPLDFLNRADNIDLQIINGIGPKYAQTIINKRNKKLFDKVDEIGLSEKIRNEISTFKFSNGHNHFTLDHVIPQKTHKFYSLCLYNFVPSCYSCNSKFKKAIPFDINNDLKKISPTSLSYSFTDDFKFNIFYINNLSSIKCNSDFAISKLITTNNDQIEKYLSMFKISGRYKFHKDIILKLIHNKMKYPESKIRETSKKMGKTQLEFKKEIFGEELFDSSKSNLPLVKFKRDIAKILNIGGII